MRLELESLEKNRQFAHSYQLEELSLEDADLLLIAPVELRGRVRQREREVELIGSLTTKLETACARCLKPVVIPFSAEFDERFATSVSWGSEEQYELASDDLNLSIFDGTGIDLDQLAREQILLAKPAH